jgi:hypothetical protein
MTKLPGPYVHNRRSFARARFAAVSCMRKAQRHAVAAPSKEGRKAPACKKDAKERVFSLKSGV